MPYDVPEWELQGHFDPIATLERFRIRSVKWISINGIADGGTPHWWEKLTANLANSEEIMSLVRSGVSINKYITHFKGRFAGQSYDLEYLVPRIFRNHELCKKFTEFVNRSIVDRIVTGAVGVIGKVSDSALPSLVMPLTVEPNKPRLCHDERYLNCWIKDMPFSLDSLLDLTRYVEEGHFQTKLDDKSGYDHVFLDPPSRQLVGFQWEGWWFVNNVLPFAWKTSPYIYQSLGLVATQTLRSSGAPCSQYIDDRHLGQLRRAISSPDVELCPTTLCSVQDVRVQLALNACYIAIRILTSLGYFLNLSKSVLVPTQSLIFLGLQCDSQLRAFSLPPPPPKLQKFAALRDTILQRREIPLVTLQRLMGK